MPKSQFVVNKPNSKIAKEMIAKAREPLQEQVDFNNFDKFQGKQEMLENVKRMFADPVELLLKDSSKPAKKSKRKGAENKETLNL